MGFRLPKLPWCWAHSKRSFQTLADRLVRIAQHLGKKLLDQTRLLPSRFYRGLIDDVQVYDEALTGAQVASLFSNPGSTAVPEPSSLMMLFATSLFGADIVRRRRSTRKP